MSTPTISRGDVLMLGLAAGVSGGLVGGMLLGVGAALVMTGVALGWLALLAGAPASALIGWLLARRLAVQLSPDG
jgi:hypothetical protein